MFLVDAFVELFFQRLDFIGFELWDFLGFGLIIF